MKGRQTLELRLPVRWDFRSRFLDRPARAGGVGKEGVRVRSTREGETYAGGPRSWFPLRGGPPARSADSILFQPEPEPLNREPETASRKAMPVFCRPRDLTRRHRRSGRSRRPRGASVGRVPSPGASTPRNAATPQPEPQSDSQISSLQLLSLSASTKVRAKALEWDGVSVVAAAY
jgi:hypothetical protein